jgi:hypothetical protein
MDPRQLDQPGIGPESWRMDLTCSLTEFFHEAVQQALERRHIETHDLTEFYLVNLLSAYSARTKFDEGPLALKLAEALDTGGVEERAQRLREVGDTTLYMSGFFAESLERRMMDLDYYCELGGAAYRRLSQIARFSREASFGEAYTELSDKFRDLVGVLNDISEAHSMTTPTGMLRLCERWARTRDDDLGRRLRAAGILPPASGEQS